MLRQGLSVSVASAIVLLIFSIVLRDHSARYTNVVEDFNIGDLRSNGTNLFKKTALIISIDGFR